MSVFIVCFCVCVNVFTVCSFVSCAVVVYVMCAFPLVVLPLPLLFAMSCYFPLALVCWFFFCSLPCWRILLMSWYVWWLVPAGVLTCLCVSLFTHLCVCVCCNEGLCLFMCLCVCTVEITRRCVSLCVVVCVSSCVYADACVCMECLCVYVYMFVHVNVCVYLYG